MSMINVMISELERLSRGEVRHPDKGICYNLVRSADAAFLGVPYAKVVAFCYGWVENNAVGWKHHTGDKVYPVPRTGRKWEGGGLELRKDLALYLLGKARGQVEVLPFSEEDC